MENVFFHPRVGKNYKTTGYNGLKLLILGESHYCEDQCPDCGIKSQVDCMNFTSKVFERYFNYKQGEGKHDNWMRTFTRFTNVFHDEQVDNETLIDFWDSVMFYNYVQSSTEEARSRPTDQQFEKSKEAFIEVLEEYKPDLIISWGERLWKKLPNIGRWGTEHILGNSNERFYYFKVNDQEIPAYSIYHPSTSLFNYEYSKYFKEILSLLNKSKENL